MGVSGSMKVKKEQFGMLPSGDAVSIFTVSNGAMSFSAIDYGCCITTLLLPNAYGGYDDVVLGYSTLEGYLDNIPHFGALIGRYAGRISNACFSLEGICYNLTPNDGGKHCLHGGYPAYDRQLWDSEAVSNNNEAGVHFVRISPDGEQGFPGSVRFEISYTLSADNTITLRYKAHTTKTTPINLTNHSYFNLNPADIQQNGSTASVLFHKVQLFADYYAEANASYIPTGRFIRVDGTPFDFRTPKVLAQGFDSVSCGYDGTWLINRDHADNIVSAAMDSMAPAAILTEPKTGRRLSVYSSQPAVTMYTANFLNGERGKNGLVYNKHSAVCLETQHIPDSPNRPEFPPVWVYPHEVYFHKTQWHFTF